MPIGIGVAAGCIVAAYGAFRGRIRSGLSCTAVLVVAAVAAMIPAFTHVRRPSAQGILANQARIVAAAAQEYFLQNSDAKSVSIVVDEGTGTVSGPLSKSVAFFPAGMKVTQGEIKGPHGTFVLEYNGWEVQMGADGPTVVECDSTRSSLPAKLAQQSPISKPLVTNPGPEMSPIDRKDLVTTIAQSEADRCALAGNKVSIDSVTLDRQNVNLSGSIGGKPMEAAAWVSEFQEILQSQPRIRQYFRSVRVVSFTSNPQSKLLEFRIQFSADDAH
jgi:hypothetical protein